MQTITATAYIQMQKMSQGITEMKASIDKQQLQNVLGMVTYMDNMGNMPHLSRHTELSRAITGVNQKYTCMLPEHVKYI